MDDLIRRKILALPDQHRIMTIATLRPDGWPPATKGGGQMAHHATIFERGKSS